MKRNLIRSIVLSSLLFAGGVAADGFGIGVKGGTLGLGVEGTFGLSERFNLRAGLNDYSLSGNEDASGIRYDAELNLSTFGLFLDWHPFAGSFRLTAGIFRNKNALDLRATPTANQTIGNTTYTPAQIGTLTGTVDFKKTAPYFGFGWGNAVRKGSALGFNFEIGAMMQGSPQVTLRSSSGLISQTDLNTEARSAEDDLKDFKVYPVISFGLSYRF
jgi:hypothetical protein